MKLAEEVGGAVDEDARAGRVSAVRATGAGMSPGLPTIGEGSRSLAGRAVTARTKAAGEDGDIIGMDIAVGVPEARASFVTVRSDAEDCAVAT